MKVAEIKKMPHLRVAAATNKTLLLKDFPIPPDWADPCVARYQNIYLDPQANSQIIVNAYTSSMDFQINNIRAWVEDISSNTNAAQIKIRLGMYTGEVLNYYSLKEDRLSVFLYPVDSTGALATYIKDSNYRSPLPGNTGTMSPASIGDQAMVYNFAGLEP